METKYPDTPLNIFLLFAFWGILTIFFHVDYGKSLIYAFSFLGGSIIFATLALSIKKVILDKNNKFTPDELESGKGIVRFFIQIYLVCLFCSSIFFGMAATVYFISKFHWNF